MKLMRFYCIVFCLVLSCSLFSQSSRISRFSVTELGKKSSLVEWSMYAGSTCFSLSVQRAVDSINFKTIYTYPGVCGSNDREVEYSWIDSNPVSSIRNYYRLKIEEVEFTLIKSIDFSSNLEGNHMLVFPNPTESTLNLGFKNSKNMQFDLLVFNNMGEIVIHQFKNHGNSVQLNVESLNTGIYIVKISLNGGGNYSTKFSRL